MKVLVVHNSYASALPSGENAAVESEMAQLQRVGIEVCGYLRSSDEIPTMGPLEKAGLAVSPIHSPKAMREITQLITATQPDVVHLHNPFPLISLSVVRTAHGCGVPIVQTVHNHRHSCLQGSHLRDGLPCFDCRGKTVPWPAAVHGCYRGSRAQSVPMTVALAAHRSDQRAIDRYIALSPDVAESLEKSGLTRPGQVVVRPNSVPDPGPSGAPSNGLLFVGRLSADKGLPLLLEAWEAAGRPFGRLVVGGDGPERTLVERTAAQPASGVEYLGPLDRAGVDRAMRSCAVVVVPSIAPEAHPLVVLEAFAHGRPVLASRRGGLVSLVPAEVGWLTEPDAVGLAVTLCQAAAADLPSLGQAARDLYDRAYSPDIVTALQIAIYEDVVAEFRARLRQGGSG